MRIFVILFFLILCISLRAQEIAASGDLRYSEDYDPKNGMSWISGSEWWTNGGDRGEYAALGYSGTATLSVPEGLSFASSILWLGYTSGGQGILTLDGQLSASAVTVGEYGDGYMTSGENSSINVTTFQIGYQENSYGEVTMNGSGSFNGLNIGSPGSGKLVIGENARIRSVMGNIAYSSGSAQAYISGEWTLSNRLQIGSGDAYMKVEAGGVVDCSYLELLHGTLDVAGDFVTEGVLRLGKRDSELSILEGGHVECRTAYLGYSSPGVFTTGVHGLLTAGGVYVGYHSDANLTVYDGGTVDAGAIYMGYSAHGDVYIQSGGVLDVGRIYIGENADSVMQIASGGMVNAETVYLTGLGAITGEGHLNATGYIGAEEINFGESSTTVVLPQGHTITDVRLVAREDGGYGTLASALLSIDASRQVTCDELFLGYNADETGSASVAGGLNVLGAIFVGFDGNGSFTDSAGSTVICENLYVGYKDGAIGTAYIHGDWYVSERVTVGEYSGEGSVSVVSGATLACEDSIEIARGSYLDVQGEITTGGLKVSGADSLTGNGTVYTNGLSLPGISLLYGASGLVLENYEGNTTIELNANDDGSYSSLGCDRLVVASGAELVVGMLELGTSANKEAESVIHGTVTADDLILGEAEGSFTHLVIDGTVTLDDIDTGSSGNAVVTLAHGGVLQINDTSALLNKEITVRLGGGMIVCKIQGTSSASWYTERKALYESGCFQAPKGEDWIVAGASELSGSKGSGIYEGNIVIKNNNNLGVPGSDTDKDGVPDNVEVIQGTNHLDPSEVFRVNRRIGGVVRFGPVHDGRSYHCLMSDSLALPRSQWSTVDALPVTTEDYAEIDLNPYLEGHTGTLFFSIAVTEDSTL